MAREESAKECVPREMGRKVCNWKCTRGSVLSTEGDCRDTTKLQEDSQTLGGRHNAVSNCSQKRVLMEPVHSCEQSCSQAKQEASCLPTA